METLFKPQFTLVNYIGVKQSFSLALLIAAIVLFFPLLNPEYAQGNVAVFTLFSVVALYFIAGVTWISLFYFNAILDAITSVSPERFDPRQIKMIDAIPHDTANKLVAPLRELARINDLHVAKLKEVAYSAGQVIETANAVSENVQNQSDATSSTASAIVEMTHSLQEVSEKISDVHESSRKAATVAQDGKRNLDALGNSIYEVNVQAKQTQDRMQQLKGLAAQVEDSSHSIQNIAQQTNLLALNASIEAARAGQFGAGFAVVAEEVRELASRSHRSAEEIVTAALSVLQQCNDIVDDMANVVEKTANCSDRADKVKQSLSDIESATKDVQHRMEIVSTNAEQQSIATNEISQHIEQVALGAKANADIAKQSETVASHLTSLTI